MGSAWSWWELSFDSFIQRIIMGDVLSARQFLGLAWRVSIFSVTWAPVSAEERGYKYIPDSGNRQA